MATARPTNWFTLEELDGGEGWIEGDEIVRWRTNRLFDPGFPFSAGVEAEESTGVYVEVDPGHACEAHTHDVEEVVLVHRGTVKFAVGGAVTARSAGEATVVPAGVTHEFRNVGDGPAAVLGFMPTGTATTTFERVVQPVGARVMAPDGPVVEEPRDGS